MAATRDAVGGRLARRREPVMLLRIAIIGGVLAVWEVLARSGLLYRDVGPAAWGV